MSCHRGQRRQRMKTSRPQFGEDGKFFVYPSQHEQDFKIAFDDDMVRGMYWDLSQRSIVYLRNHGCIQDIIDTCEHETLHHCFADVFVGTLDDEPIEMDVYQEHWALRKIVWRDHEDFERNNSVIREDIGDTNDDLFE